ncbi:hypothetical protein GOP47_0019032 [Adiantum capillus-veneris]|uniref:Uncharacterized protein n=1 Tax=Adiantum capillus-veneris TaxID=13818 RepID=A0A9D4UF98_ADICA|nr:hypothetical protein GOP47_0019032 [Adiantum capillus-veneris]
MSKDDLDAILRILLEAKTCGDVIRCTKSVRLGPVDVREDVHQAMWDVDMKAAACAWQIEYVVSEPVLALVAKQLESCASNWNKHEWYVPLVALVQSSGWGKSRLMCQLWRKGFYVFYLSCMAEKQTGFPRRTGKLADIMQSPKPSGATFVALVASVIAVLNKHARNMTCEQWIQAQEKDDAIQQEVLNVYNQKLPTITQYDNLERSKAEAQFELCFKEEIDQCKVKLLLCIDEAGELGDNFATFRRSLRSIPQGKSFFTVVLGTDRKVADQAAAAEDASARVRLANPYHVYHPLYLIGKSDIFATPATDSGSEAEISTAAKDVIRYGRPLWAAYYDSVEETNKLEATIQFAKMKLLGRNIDTTEGGWVTRDIAVAVFASLVGVQVVAWGSLLQQLVAKHMRTIVNISKDRRRVYTAAAAELVLAAAAAKLLHAHNDAFLGDFLTKMIEVFEDGLVLEGVRGEVVARIIILLAMHECTQEGNYIQPVTLATFLKTMVGKSNVDKLNENCCNLEGYYLFFNSFSPISVEIFKQLAEAAFARCTALTAQRNETILDLALPCHFTLGASARSRPMQATVMMELENQPTQGVAVTIQVKNQRNDNPMQREIEELRDDDRLSAPVQLFLHIGHRGESKIQVNHETVVVYGIDCFEHLKSQKMQNLKVLEKLKLLSRTCEDVFKDASQEERDILKDMILVGLASKSFLEDMTVDDEPQIPMKWSRTSLS